VSRQSRFPLRPQRIGLVLVALLLLGICCRWVNLDRKVYWHDEAYTSLRISGYTVAEVRQQVFNGQPIAVAALQVYQRPTPEKGSTDTIRTLAIDDAQHPPLYYLLVRLWVEIFGSSIVAIRSLSVLSGLLVFPLIYLLCRELFTSPLVGGMAVALIAVSPFHLLYAQEAREYALWTALILGSSWALLRALRLKTIGSWVVYALTLILGFYTYLLTILVAIGHGAYVLVVERRPSRSAIAYLLASAFAGVAFAPWLWVIAVRQAEIGASLTFWTSIPIPLDLLFKTWGINLERAFLLTPGDFGFDTAWVYATLPFLVVLTGYAFYSLCCQTSYRVWWFVLTLIGSTALPLVLPDLLLGGQRSTSSRYLVPCYLGIELAVAYLFASQITSRARLQRVWCGIVAIVLGASAVSCVEAARADTAWNKVISYNNLAIAKTVNQAVDQAQRPLLITSSFGINFGNILALSHQLAPQVTLQLVEEISPFDLPEVPQIPQGFSPVFLLNPSDLFRHAVEQQQNTTTDLVFNDSHLWLWQLRSP
jgi:uncharacterized membrane protein